MNDTLVWRTCFDCGDSLVVDADAYEKLERDLAAMKQKMGECWKDGAFLCERQANELAATNGENYRLREEQKAADTTIKRLLERIEELKAEIDDALAVTKAPDSTNDGGRANVAEEMRRLKKELEISYSENERLRELLMEAEQENIALRCRNTSQVIAEWRNENERLRELLSEIYEHSYPTHLEKRIRALIAKEEK